MDENKNPTTITGSVFGDYELEKKIGLGGMGTVYLARNQHLNMPVAIKVLKPELSFKQGSNAGERFLQEAQLASRLNHPNIVTILDYGEDNRCEFYVMHYIKGENVYEKIHRDGPLELEKALDIIGQVADGVHYAHEQQIIHRDLKSANILIDPKGRPLIADFGIAKDLASDRKLTKTGAVVGTPAYVAPEHIQGHPSDPQTDVYALGVLLFEMLTGRPPYVGNHPGDIYNQTLNHPVPSLLDFRPEVPVEVNDICQKALAKDRSDRYATALELGEEIRPVLERECDRSGFFSDFLGREQSEVIEEDNEVAPLPIEGDLSTIDDLPSEEEGEGVYVLRGKKGREDGKVELREGALLGEYYLKEQIGRGGMGVVFKAYQTRLERTVALKILPQSLTLSGDAITRFRREVRAAANLQHPNIVQVYQADNKDGVYYYAMQYVDGKSLDKVIALGECEMDQVVNYMIQACEGLHYAHEFNMIHRDIKPSNLMVNEEGRLQITDFGLVRDCTHEEASLTLTGTVLGTPAYMSPEQSKGEVREVDQQSDVYSLGATMYHLLTGQAPFQGGVQEILYKLMSEDPTPPRLLNPQIPLDLETIALKGMEKEKSRRYASAQAMADDLKRYRDGEPILARPLSKWERLWRKGKKNKALVVAMVAVLTVLAVWGYFALESHWASEKLDQTEREKAVQEEISRGLALIDKNPYEAQDILEKILGRWKDIHDTRSSKERREDLYKVYQGLATACYKIYQLVKDKKYLHKIERYCSQIIDVDPEGEVTSLYFRRAQARQKLGREDFLDDLNRALQLTPGHLPSHFMRGEYYLQRNQWEKAQRDFEYIVRDSKPQTLSALYHLCTITYYRKQYTKLLGYSQRLIEKYRRQISNQKYSRLVYYQVEATLHTKGFLVPNREVYVLRFFPDKTKWMMGLVKRLDEAIQYDPQHGEAFLLRGVIKDIYPLLLHAQPPVPGYVFDRKGAFLDLYRATTLVKGAATTAVAWYHFLRVCRSHSDYILTIIRELESTLWEAFWLKHYSLNIQSLNTILDQVLFEIYESEKISFFSGIFQYIALLSIKLYKKGIGWLKKKKTLMTQDEHKRLKDITKQIELSPFALYNFSKNKVAKYIKAHPRVYRSVHLTAILLSLDTEKSDKVLQKIEWDLNYENTCLLFSLISRKKLVKISKIIYAKSKKPLHVESFGSVKNLYVSMYNERIRDDKLWPFYIVGLHKEINSIYVSKSQFRTLKYFKKGVSYYKKLLAFFQNVRNYQDKNFIVHLRLLWISIDLFTKSIQEFPHLSLPYYYRGLCYLYLGRFKSAQYNFKMALANNPFNIRALIIRRVNKVFFLNRNSGLSNKTNLLQGEQTARSILSSPFISKKDVDWVDEYWIATLLYIKFFQAVCLYHSSKNSEEAPPDLKSIIDKVLAKESRGFSRWLGWKFGDHIHNEILRDFRPPLICYLGIYLRKRALYQLAVEAFTLSIYMDEDYPLSYFRRAEARMKIHRVPTPQVIEDYASFIRLSPHASYEVFTRMSSLQKYRFLVRAYSGKFLPKLRKLIRNHPESPNGYFILALYYYCLKEWDKARENAKKYIQIDDKLSPFGYALIGRTYYEQGKYNTSLSFYARSRVAFRKYHPSQGEFALPLYWAASSELKLGRQKRALQFLRGAFHYGFPRNTLQSDTDFEKLGQKTIDSLSKGK